MFKLTVLPSDRFDATMRTVERDGIITVTLCAACKSTPAPLRLELDWQIDNIGTHLCWHPNAETSKRIRPNWGGLAVSNAMFSAPVHCNVAYNDRNRMTIACSDAKNRVEILSGVIEENAKLSNRVVICMEYAVSTYTAEVRIDTRDLPFYQCISDVADWWASHDGYEPTPVPDAARRPVYSSWYSFHRQIDIPRILDECRYYKALGCESIIIDDGWQTDDNGRGYDYCGDREPPPAKIPDMKAFVDAVHETGMKFILRYSVPFVGSHTRAMDRFRDKLLKPSGIGSSGVPDPRYPEVREYLIGCYQRAMIDWGLDGFKLDFIDSFSQSDTIRDGMDCVSVYDGVDRLMKDVIATLRALNPEVLIEFRQCYIGPLMRTFGNMLRASDCPNDSYTNRSRILALRMTAGRTAVHSDMVMWNYRESAEEAAFQLTNILFAVPQISVLHNAMPSDHRKMVAHYLGLWTRYRNVLLDGDMLYKEYTADFSYVSARLGDTQVGAVYAGQIAYLEVPTGEIVLVNATMNRRILLDAAYQSRYTYTVTDCCGSETACGICDVGYDMNMPGIEVPVNGVVRLTRV